MNHPPGNDRRFSLLDALFPAGLLAVAACSGTPSAASNDDGGSGTEVADSGEASDGPAATTTDGGASTADVQCDYAYSGFNSSASVEKTSTTRWSCTSTLRSVAANGIPDHPTGTFPNANNPNAISEQTVAASMTLTPVETGTATTINIVGYAFNGVKFDPSTAGTCGVTNGTTSCTLLGSDGTWTIEALGQSSFDFGVDDNNAHVQPNGAYHYHGMPEGILTKLGKGMAPTLVGYALDGFPVYARYGYTTPTDATSEVKVLESSYKVKSTPDSGRPPVASYPMGAFTQDYEYVAGAGDLDECNGRTDVTPEFPKGIYHYYITDSYPFIQRCVKGTPMGGGEGGGDGGMMGPPGPGGDGGMMGPPPPPDGG